MFAVITKGSVFAIVESPEGVTPDFDVIEAPEEVQIGWRYTGTQFLPPIIPVEVIRVNKVRFFQELFTFDEQRLYNRIKRQVLALQDEDYDSTDPHMTLLVAAEVLLQYLNDIEWIELTNEKTQYACVMLLPALGVITQARGMHILENKLPDEE